MSSFKGRPPVRGTLANVDATEALQCLLKYADRAKEGWILDTALLYATIAFTNSDVARDIQEYARDVRPHLPTDELKSIAYQCAADPCRANVVSLMNQARGWLLIAAAARGPGSDAEIVTDVVRRTALYAAAIGHVGACQDAATYAYAYAGREQNATIYARYVAVALHLLERADVLTIGTKKIQPMDAPGWMRAALTNLRLASFPFGDFERADNVLAARSLNKTNPMAELLSDLPDVSNDAVTDPASLLSVVDPVVRVEVRQQPTIVVIPSLNHLPETKPSSHANPRAEFSSLAEKELPTASVPDLHAVSKELRAEMPWAAEAIEAMLMDLVGAPFVRFRPTLLVSKPGVGKTRLIRRLGEATGLHTLVYPASVAADGSFAGTSRQWSTGRPSLVLSGVARARMATVLVGLDEIEKAASGNAHGRLTDVLIPFLERESASRYVEPYLECPVDLSAVSFLATANSISIPGPLLDRFRVLEIGMPKREHLQIAAKTVVSEIRRERDEDVNWLPDLDGDELNVIASQWKGGSLRPLRRMIEAIIAGRHLFSPQH
jgi:hypothetical protein